MNRKNCSSCGVDKSISQYYRYPGGKIHSRCNGCRVEYSTRKHLERTYGLSIEKYETMLKQQEGLCAICGKSEVARTSKRTLRDKLSVDHCHKTGKVRALLCRKCNMVVGGVNESVEISESVVSYLRSWS